MIRNNRKIKTKPKVRPKPKKVSTTPKKPSRPNPKKFRAVKIGKGVKRPKTKAMQGMSSAKSMSDIKNDILEERTNQKQDIAKLDKKISKLKTLRISIPGLQELREPSVNKIQKDRLDISLEIKELSDNLVSSAKKLTKIETRYRKQKS